MLDQTIRRLLEHVVNSPVKLQLTLLFAENPQLTGGATQIAQRVYRDIWSTREALQELDADGVLCAKSAGAEPIYRFCPRPDLVEPIRRLTEAYNEPFVRDRVQKLVREIASYAPYRGAAVAMDFEFI